jgi:tripartite-type tricarboxylate transporter receptor subunit TctC
MRVAIRSLCTVAVIAALAVAWTTASAQVAYPAKPIRLIVPTTVGTSIDIIARVIAQRLPERLKVTVFVDNRPGASGDIGTDAVSKTLPDGYTLLVTTANHVISPALQSNPPYDPIRGFTPIGPLAIGNLALVVHPSTPARSVTELVALAKAQPETLNYASPGNGTPHHMAMELFKLHFGVKLQHVPYKGTAGALSDLLGGQVQVMFLPLPVALTHVQAGKLRMLAAGGAQRTPATPDMPSLAEAGLTDVDVSIWYAVLGPPGLAKEQVSLLNSEVNAILSRPEVRDLLLKQGINPTPGTPEQLAKTIEVDLARWTRIVRAANIRSD